MLKFEFTCQENRLGPPHLAHPFLLREVPPPHQPMKEPAESFPRGKLPISLPSSSHPNSTPYPVLRGSVQMTPPSGSPQAEGISPEPSLPSAPFIPTPLTPPGISQQAFKTGQFFMCAQDLASAWRTFGIPGSCSPKPACSASY